MRHGLRGTAVELLGYDVLRGSGEAGWRQGLNQVWSSGPVPTSPTRDFAPETAEVQG